MCNVHRKVQCILKTVTYLITQEIVKGDSQTLHACLCQFLSRVTTFNLLLPTLDGSVSLYILAIGLKTFKVT